MGDPGRHLLSVLVENKPGVLTRIAGMFARRGYNIHSLAVGPTDDPTLSRLTLVVGSDAVQVVAYSPVMGSSSSASGPQPSVS